MSDLRELTRETDMRLRARVHLAPAAAVMAEGRRQRALSTVAVATVGLLVAVALLPAWRHSGQPDPASGWRLDTSIVLDDGALILDPPGSARPGISDAQARGVSPQIVSAGLGDLQRLVLARVHANVPPDPDATRGSTVAGTWSLAWVQLYRAPLPTAACPPPLANATPAVSPTRPTDQNALIIDAATGAATIYYGYGVKTCPPATPPELVPAHATFSVPFDEQPDGWYLIHLPPCGVLSVAMQGFAETGRQIGGVSDRELEIRVIVPIGPCARRSPTSQHLHLPGLRQPVLHAPVGQRVLVGGHVVIEPTPTRT